MAEPSLTDVNEALLADERLVHLVLQAQEQIINQKGTAPDGATCAATLSQCDLIASIIRSTAFAVQQQLQSALPPTPRMPPKAPQHTDALQAAVLSAAQHRWQALILERLQAAQMFLPDMPLAAVPRTAHELEALRNQVADVSAAWERIGASRSPFTGNFPAPSISKLLYDAEDVLQAVTTVVAVPQDASQAATQATRAVSSSSSSQPPSTAAQPQQLQLSLVQAVKAPTRMWLQSFFADLKPDTRQVGMDDVLHPWFREQQVQQAYRAAASCSAAACRAAARAGLPASERPWVWAAALGVHAVPPPLIGNNVAQEGSSTSTSGSGSKKTATPNTAGGKARAVGSSSSGSGVQQDANDPAACCGRQLSQFPSQRDQQLLQLLCESVEQQVLLTDVLTCADAQHMADNEHYFVFEEAMRAILLAFSRDASASTSAAVPAAPRLASETKRGEHLKPYPPSGILPFQGLASYLAPLCFLYGQPAAAYRVFWAMYVRYWSCLHTLNLRPAPAPGLPVLCRTFLELLQEIDPEVHQHLSRLTSSPLDLAFPWIFSAFVGYLSPSETLLLWDRIIGFDSLLPLPVLAAAVMTFRRDLVLAVQSSDELLEVLEDLSQLRVVPLMQALLFDT